MPKMEFRNVVFNAARDGKLRRLKVGISFIDQASAFFSSSSSSSSPSFDFTTSAEISVLSLNFNNDHFCISSVPLCAIDVHFIQQKECCISHI